MQPSLYHNTISRFPQPHQVQKPNHQHIPKHIKRSLNDIKFGPIHVFPLHWHLSDLYVEDIAQYEQLDIECPSLDVQHVEECFR